MKLYGSKEYAEFILEELSKDYPLLQWDSKSRQNSLIGLIIDAKNAQVCRQWENYVTINSLIYKSCQKLLSKSF